MRLNLITLSILGCLFFLLSCSNDDEPTITINLLDLEVTIDENPANRQVIGTVQTDKSGTLSFNITSQTPTGALSIDASSGEVTVSDETLFDFETNPTITATVSAEGAVNTATVTINLANVSELSVEDFSATIDENSTNGTSLGTVQATGDGTLSFSITSQTPTGALSIDATSGELNVADETLFDFEMNPTITATIEVDNTVSTEDALITINLDNVNEIGDFNYGGVIFWLNETKDEGLVCAVTDQSSSIRWHNTTQPTITGTTSTSINTGSTNTDLIIASLGSDFAAGVARAYNGGGFNDWFLPSVDELKEMANNIAAIDATAVANSGTALVADPPNVSNGYWSSSQQSNGGSVYLVNLLLAGENGALAINFANVRAVRSFTD